MLHILGGFQAVVSINDMPIKIIFATITCYNSVSYLKRQLDRSQISFLKLNSYMYNFPCPELILVLSSKLLSGA